MAEQSLRESIEAAVEATPVETVQTEVVEAVPEKVQEAPQETAQETADRLRDEKGRFAAKQVEVEAAVVPEVVVPERKPPSSWKKDYWDDWKTLPQKVQDYIEQREGEALRGVTTYKQQAEAAREIQARLAPRQEQLAREYGSTANGIDALFQLSDFAAQNPQGFITWFAQQRNIDLGQLTTAAPVQATQEYVQLQQQVLGLQNQLRAFQQQTSMSQEQAIQGEIARWAEGKEHLDDVREDMAALLHAGRAKDLDDAYNKALRLNEPLWEQIQTKTRQDEQAGRLKEAAAQAQAAKAAAVQVKGAPANTAAVGTPSGSLRAHLESAFGQTNRV